MYLSVRYIDFASNWIWNCSDSLVFVVFHILLIQWNLSNPTHQGTREMCRIVQDVGKLRFSF
jgi:hypothetical protein